MLKKNNFYIAATYLYYKDRMFLFILDNRNLFAKEDVIITIVLSHILVSNFLYLPKIIKSPLNKIKSSQNQKNLLR